MSMTSLPLIQATEIFTNSNFSSIGKTLLSVELNFCFCHRELKKFDVQPRTKQIIDKNLTQNIWTEKWFFKDWKWDFIIGKISTSARFNIYSALKWRLLKLKRNHRLLANLIWKGCMCVCVCVCVCVSVDPSS